MKKAKADLHTHTTCSDGSTEPDELVRMASELGIKHLAITDHDTFEGYKMAEVCAQELNIDLICGMELTTSFEGRESHLLAYEIDPENPLLNDLVKEQRRIRKVRMRRIVDKVQKQGFDISYDEVRAEANKANLGRPHIAMVLMNKGYVGSINEAFIRYLNNEKLNENHTEYVDFREAIHLLKSAGAVTVLAHPGVLYSDSELKEIIDVGVDGLECIHPSHNYDLQKKFDELCDKYLLLKTGGSDFHGHKHEKNRHFGTVTIPGKHADKLKSLSEQRKALNGIT
jgi:hypothetical protein